MLKKFSFLIVIFLISGCATTTPPPAATTVETPPPLSFDNETKTFIEEKPLAVQGTLAEATQENKEPSKEPAEDPVIENGIVFAKTSFEGVLKTSFVRLKFVDLAFPDRVYELHIGEKVPQQPFSFNVKTVNPGYFYIELPVGNYEISSVTIPVGGTTATEDINIIFKVLPNQITYMGTLRMIGTKEKIKLGGVPVIKPGFEYEVAVINELAEAQNAFVQRFPNVSDPISIELMKIIR